MPLFNGARMVANAMESLDVDVYQNVSLKKKLKVIHIILNYFQ